MLNSFSFDRNGNLMQLDDIIAEKSRRKPSPSPTPQPLPPADMTIRFRFSNPDFDPNTLEITAGTWTKVQYAAGNDWDFTNENSNWESLFSNKLTSTLGTISIIDNGDLSGITTLNRTFKQCPALVYVKLTSLNNVTNMNGTFDGCNNLTTAHIYDTEKVNDLGGTFNACSSLSDVILPTTGEHANFAGAFKFCTSLASYAKVCLDNGDEFSAMFYGCSSLKDISVFQISPHISAAAMFCECVNVETGMYDLYVAMNNSGAPFQGPPFTRCGINTDSGQADRAKIPVMWGGDMQ